MKILILSTLLAATTVFAHSKEISVQQVPTNAIIKCSKACGAVKNSKKQVNIKACSFTKLAQGCFCGTKKEVRKQIKSCKTSCCAIKNKRKNLCWTSWTRADGSCQHQGNNKFDVTVLRASTEACKAMIKSRPRKKSCGKPVLPTKQMSFKK
jgi:hypothetical protein